MALIDTRYGPIALPDGGTDLIGQHLARYGEWAWCEAAFIASVLDEGARLLDGGAYLGTFGLGVALQVKLGFLCAIEANREAAQYLRQNLARLSPCPTEQIAAILIGNDPVPESGHAVPGNMGSTSFVVVPDDTEDMTCEAPSRRETLAGLRERFGAFDMIKLDIEGMELPVLQADAAALREGSTTIWTECNESVKSLHLADFFLSLELPLWYFAFPSHYRKNVHGIADAIFPMGFEAGLLAAPRRAPELLASLVDEGCILRRIESVGALREAMWLTPRWGRPGWEKARSREELAAVAGRELLGQTFETYLMAPEAGLPAAQSLWDKLNAMEIALEEAKRLALANDTAREQAGARAQAAQLGMAAEAAKAAQDASAREEAAKASAAGAEAARAAMAEALREAQANAASAEAATRAAEAEAARQAARRLELLAKLGDLEAQAHGAPMLVPATEMRGSTAVAVADQLADLRRKLRDIETSTSWIVTAPLRAVIGHSTSLHRTLRLGRKLAGKAVRGIRKRPDR